MPARFSSSCRRSVRFAAGWLSSSSNPRLMSASSRITCSTSEGRSGSRRISFSIVALASRIVFMKFARVAAVERRSSHFWRLSATRRCALRIFWNDASTLATFSGFSSPPSGSRISSAAGAVPFFTSAGQAQQRVERTRDGAQRGLHLPARFFDAQADFLFLLRREQLPLTHRLQVEADQVEVLARDARFEPLLRFVFFAGSLRVTAGRRALVFVGLLVVTRTAVAVRLGFFLFDQAVGGQHHGFGLFCLAGWMKTELVRALAPVEHVCVVLRFLPVDQRGRARPFARTSASCRHIDSHLQMRCRPDEVRNAQRKDRSTSVTMSRDASLPCRRPACLTLALTATLGAWPQLGLPKLPKRLPREVPRLDRLPSLDDLLNRQPLTSTLDDDLAQTDIQVLLWSILARAKVSTLDAGPRRAAEILLNDAQLASIDSSFQLRIENSELRIKD